MLILRVVLLAFALVLFLLAAVGIAHPRLNLMSLGLAFLTAAIWLEHL